MRLSTRHLLAQRLIAMLALLVFIGALQIWPMPMLEALPCWAGLLALAIFAVALLSGLGLGPWGRRVNELTVIEDEEYRKSLQSKQPWQ